jgi:hypothetical protein
MSINGTATKKKKKCTHTAIFIHHRTNLHDSSIHCLYNVFLRFLLNVSKHGENGCFVDEVPFKIATHRS